MGTGRSLDASELGRVCCLQARGKRRPGLEGHCLRSGQEGEAACGARSVEGLVEAGRG